MVTVVGADVFEHPLTLVTVTKYDVVTAGLMVMLCVVAPLLHA